MYFPFFYDWTYLLLIPALVLILAKAGLIPARTAGGRGGRV